MLRRYYGKISKLPINEFFGHDGELVVDDITGKVYVMDGVTLGGTELVGATPRFGTTPPISPTPGTLWYDPNSGRTYIYFQDTWVDAAPNTVYTLPEASDTVLGGVKVGNNLSIDEYGVLSAEDGNYTLPTANNTVLGGVKVDNVSILINGSGVISANIADIRSNLSTQASNISTLFSNAANQASNISTLFSNAETQSGLISTINANIAAANSSIANKNTLTNNGKTLTFTNGNLILPGEGNITSTSGNITVQSNVFATGFFAKSTTTPTGGPGFLFLDPVSNRYNAGMRHNGSENVVQIVHQGNVGLNIFPNGAARLGNITTFGIISKTIETGFISTNKVLANISSNNGYRFYDDETPTTTAIIHNDSTNQLQLVHENGNVSLNSNGTFQTSNIILSGTTLSTQSGTLYVNGVAVGVNDGATVEPSSTPPVDPVNGQLWYDTDSGKIYVYLTDSWVDASPTLIPSISSLVNGDFSVTLDVDGNLNLPEGGDILDSNGNSVLGTNNYGNAKVAAYLPTNSIIIGLKANANIQAIAINTLTANALSQATQINGLRANINAANSAIITANVAMKSYVDNALSNSNSNSATQSIQINNLTANALSQATQINGLRANIIAANSAIISANVGMKTYVDDAFVTFGNNLEQSLQPILTQFDADLVAQTANSLVQALAINTLTANALSQDTQIKGLRANINAANAAIITANVGMKSYVDSILVPNSAAQEDKITSLIANANIQAIAIDTLTANALSQDTQIKGLRANINAANAAIITANVGMKSYVDDMLSISTSNAASQSITINTLTANALSQDTQIKGLRANINASNAAIITANIEMKSYVDTITNILTANTITQENKIITLIANSNTQAIFIDTLTANALSQDTQIKGLRANITASNAAIITANVGMKSYVDTITDVLTANTVAQENKLTIINANLAEQATTAATQTTAINTLTANSLSQDTQIKGLRANITAANSAIITANVAMKSYVDTITDILAANAFTQENKITLMSANLAGQTINASMQATTINNLTANALSQDTQIVELRANIISANSSITTLKTQVYSDANVFAFLPTYSGRVGGDISIGGILQIPPQTKAANATGTVGQICWDSNYIYICTATNTWKRVALTGGY